MGDIVYSNKEFIIVKKQRHGSKGFIVINTNKEFECGHTHIKNFNTAKTLINLAKYSKEPKSANKYLLNSLIRISNDDKYIKILQEKLNK